MQKTNKIQQRILKIFFFSDWRMLTITIKKKKKKEYKKKGKNTRVGISVTYLHPVKEIKLHAFRLSHKRTVEIKDENLNTP